jgi:putative acetyltransferase
MENGNTDNIVPCCDYRRMMEIWLAASIEAHDFVSGVFWRRHAESMELHYLPMAENYACIDDGTVVGFISLRGCRVEALFVMPSHRNRDVGRMLLDKAKSLCSRLTLAVYSENRSAVDFYMRNGFTVVEERTDHLTGHPEKIMTWTAGERK